MELRRVLRALIVRRILADEPQIEVVGESDSLTEAVGLMQKLAADVLLLAPGAQLNVVAPTATAPSAEVALIQETPTPRELEVLRMIEQGLTNREMAGRFQRSTRAIQFHVSNLLSKLGAHSRTELIHVARKRGWLD